MNNITNRIGNLTDRKPIPESYLGYEANRIIKEKAINHFKTMKIGQSFTVEGKSVESVKSWQKEWRRDLRLTEVKSNLELAERGFITKYEKVNGTAGCRVWRFK